MISFTNAQIVAPRDWQEFEDLCADLWMRIWKDPDTQKHGRGGQEQNGIDIYGCPDQGPRYEGIQCKGKDGRYGKFLTEKELRSEVAKAKGFKPRIAKLTVATTAPNDQKIQAVARDITEQHRAEGLFDVVVLGWEEIQRRIAEFPDLQQKYYSQFIPTVTNDIALERADQVVEESRREEQQAIVVSQLATIEGLLRGQEKRSDDPLEAYLNEDIDQCREWIKEHRPKEAIEQLERLRERHWEDASGRTKFRIATNIAAANLILGNLSLAVTGYFEALEHDPEDEKALCNVALAHLLLGNNAEALAAAERALAVHPDSARAHSLVVAAFADDETVNDPTPLVPLQFHSTPDVAFAFGQVFGKRGGRKDALQWMERAFAADPTSIDVRAGLGGALLSALISDEAVGKGGALSAEQRAAVQRGRDLLAGVWDEVRGTAAAGFYSTHAFNLASAEDLLGNLDAAQAVAEEASRADPSQKMFFRQIALLHMKQDNFESAVRVLQDLPDDAFPEKPLMHAEALRATGRYDEARQKVDGFLTTPPSPEFHSAAVGLRVRIIREESGVDAALGEVATLLCECADDVLLQVQYSELLADSGDIQGAERAALEAAATLGSGCSYFERMSVAEGLFRRRLYTEAAGIYRTLLGEGGDSLAMRQLLPCLLETDRRKEALEIVDGLPARAKAQPYYLKIAGMLHRRIGDLAAARESFEAYVELLPTDLQVRLGWAEVVDRLGDSAAVQAFLDGPLDFSVAKANDRVQLAHLLNNHGRGEKALAFAYETLRRFPDDRNAHLGYIFLLLPGGHLPAWAITPEVGVDTAFALEKDGGALDWFIVEGDSTRSFTRRELAPDHPIARNALGARVGDTVLVAKNAFGNDERRVVEIKHKYLYALHESMEEFGHRFPADKSLIKIEVPSTGNGQKDLAPILGAVARRSAAMAELEKSYRDQPLPIGVFARLAGVNPVDAWAGLASREPFSLYCCAGTRPEREDAFRLIDESPNGWMIDPITLYSMCAFGVQDIVAEALGNIGIAQSTFDLFDNLLAERKHFESGGFLSLGKEGEDFVRHEVTKGAVEENMRRIEDTAAWARERCTVIPAVGAGDPPPEWLQLFKSMDGAFSDTLLAANGSERTLLCDDQRLRFVGREAFRLEGVWLQPVLMKAVERGLMSKDRYAEAVETLVRCGYFFTSLDSDVLLVLAERAGSWPTEQFKSVAATLGHQASDLASSIQVGIGLLQRVWRKPLPWWSQKAFLGNIANILVENHQRSTYAIIDYLAEATTIVAPHPIDQGRYLSSLYDWCIGHFLEIPPGLGAEIRRWHRAKQSKDSPGPF